MISVVIATLNDERTLGDTLGALVAAAVDALVREVIVVDGGSTDHTLEIADDAGARILKGAGPEGIAQGMALAKGDWLLVLDAKAPPPSGWENAILDHVREHPDNAAWWGQKRGAAFWKSPKPQGVLVPRALYDRSGLSLKGARRLSFGR
jgi:cellulose synthase/poly-beta-1,6-N-acetylglucosamine synthase-like glycosyltransferase